MARISSKLDRLERSHLALWLRAGSRSRPPVKELDWRNRDFLLQRWDSYAGVLSRIKKDEQTWMSLMILVFGAVLGFLITSPKLATGPAISPGMIVVQLFIAVSGLHFLAWIFFRHCLVLRMQYYRSLWSLLETQFRLTSEEVPLYWFHFDKSFDEWYSKATRPFESKFTEIQAISVFLTVCITIATYRIAIFPLAEIAEASLVPPDLVAHGGRQAANGDFSRLFDLAVLCHCMAFTSLWPFVAYPLFDKSNLDGLDPMTRKRQREQEEREARKRAQEDESPRAPERPGEVDEEPADGRAPSSGGTNGTHSEAAGSDDAPPAPRAAGSASNGSGDRRTGPEEEGKDSKSLASRFTSNARAGLNWDGTSLYLVVNYASYFLWELLTGGGRCNGHRSTWPQPRDLGRSSWLIFLLIDLVYYVIGTMVVLTLLPGALPEGTIIREVTTTAYHLLISLFQMVISPFLV